jgi:lipoprotein-releasing system permease protein
MFSVNEDLDNKYIFMRLSAARTLLNYSDSTASALEIKLSDPKLEDEVRQEIEALLMLILRSRTVQLNGALYKC